VSGAMGERIIDTVTVETVDPSGDTSASVTSRQLRGSSLLLVGRFLALGLNFAVQLLIARYLTQSDYGAFAYALSMVTLFETIVTVGLDRGVGRFLAIYDERADFARMAGTIVLIAVTILSLGAALVVLAPLQAADNLLSGVLAVFASARAIFFRKYVLGPGLRLVVVALLIAGSQGVGFLAVGYVVSGVIGVLLYVGILWRILHDRGVFAGMRRADISIPAREIFAFTIPLLTTDVVYLALNTTDAIFLGHFWGTTEVADYRVIQPLVGVNTVVYSAFTLLYMPAATRLFARGDRSGVADLYWKTAIWMAILTFPVFALTTSLAEPVTVALYQERYADSAIYLALLSFAAYVNVALGFNGLTLRVYGFVRYTVGINLVAAAISVGLNLLLIPPYGALGAAVATTVSLIIFNLLKQAGLRRGTGISVFDRRFLWVYATIALAAVALALVQLAVQPGFLLSLVLAAITSLIVLAVTRRALDVADTFPEILRVPFARRLLGV
jgi:O-antigen/teichoic acid export membrane protein